VRIICVAGARPNYMKVKPVMDALEAGGAEVILVHTGQHYDPAMNDVFFADLGIRKPDHFLQVGSASHAVQTGKVMSAFEPMQPGCSVDDGLTWPAPLHWTMTIGSALAGAAVAATAVPAIVPAATRPAPSTTRRRVSLIERSPPSGNNSTRRDAADAQLVGRS